MENIFGWMIVEDTYFLYWSGLGMTTPNTWLDTSYSLPEEIDDDPPDKDEENHYDP